MPHGGAACTASTATTWRSTWRSSPCGW
jgi:hypothetical protein